MPADTMNKLEGENTRGHNWIVVEWEEQDYYYNSYAQSGSQGAYTVPQRTGGRQFVKKIMCSYCKKIEIINV